MMTNPAVERTSRIKPRDVAHLERFIVDASRPRQRGSRLINCPIGPLNQSCST